MITSSANSQIMVSNQFIYDICDDNNDGFTLFELHSKDSEILGNLSSNLYTINYYLTSQDAYSQINSLNNQYQNTISFQQDIFIRVQENLNINNFQISVLRLKVNYLPTISEMINPFLAIYENPFDGFGIFDLSIQNNLIIGIQPQISITYFLTQNDAQNETNSIINPTQYFGSNNQTIWIFLNNTITGCQSISNFQLKVFDSNSVINFPDAIFRDKLLSSNANNYIAIDSSNESVKIDVNNDGALQFEEVSEITKINVSNNNSIFKITSVEGIQFFTNLFSLDCSNNLLNNLNENYLTNLTELDCSSNPLNNLNLPLLNNLKILKYENCNLPNLDFSNSLNLRELYCMGNSIQSINLNFVQNLNALRCSSNQIQNLNLSILQNLNYLDCSYNQIQNLDLSNNLNLNSIFCLNNQLTNLNLESQSSLEYLYCDFNNLTSLNLSNLTQLKNFSCIFNQINSLVLGNFTNIINFNCRNNLLTTLDASMINTESNYIFDCSSNINLLQAFIKNSSNSGYFLFSGCSSLEYVCCETNSVSYYQDIMVTSFNLFNVVVNSYCSFTPGGNYNTITGTTKFDANNNGCDTNDLPQKNLRVNINDGTTTGASFTNATGNYKFYTQAGSFNITPSIENPTWFNFSPISATIPFANNNNNVATQDFCIAANGIHNDLEIVIAPITPARPGFDATYLATYKNKGNQTVSGNLNFNYDDSILDFVYSTFATTTQSLGILNYNFTNLLPFESRSFHISLNVNSPTETPAVNIGDILNFSATINTTLLDEIPSDNLFTYNQTVVGSFDPNNIICMEGESVAASEIGNYLHYVINFENTGTFQAENIVVKTTIDPNQFDINSLQLLSASNQVDARITGNVVEFIFEQIMLDTGGHGNVLLKVKSKNNLQQGDIVSKRADIFFDYNAPIDTGIANTTFQSLNNSSFIIDNSISVYPNPANSIVNIIANSNLKSIQLYDVQGRILQTKIVNQTTENLDISNQSKGIYFLKITSDDGVKVEQIVKE